MRYSSGLIFAINDRYTKCEKMIFICSSADMP